MQHKAIGIGHKFKNSDRPSPLQVLKKVHKNTKMKGHE